MQMILPENTTQLSTQIARHLHTQKWYAWMPFSSIGPQSLYITGEVEGRNAGMELALIKKKNACAQDMLCLEMVLRQREGDWPELACWLNVSYQEVVFGPLYTMIHIFVDGRLIEKFPIDIIQG